MYRNYAATKQLPRFTSINILQIL